MVNIEVSVECSETSSTLPNRVKFHYTKGTHLNWNNRGDRLARIKERDEFARYFMPLSFWVGAVGLGFIGFQFFDRVLSGAWSRQYLGVGVCLLGVPLALFFYRLIRGHFSPRLKD